MSLLFGNLAQDFVLFQRAIFLAERGDAIAAAQVPEATRQFKRVAALDASYLVYMGLSFGHCQPCDRRSDLVQVSAFSSLHTFPCTSGGTLAR